MIKMLLIPGYATKVSSPIRPARGEDGGFGALAKEVTSGRATVYHWGITEHISFLRSLNPFYYLSLYRRERVLASSSQTLQALDEQLRQHQPDVIVCHSMGCLFLLKYIKCFSLPTSVRSIVFVQADIDVDEQIVSTTPIINLYCPWDPTLLVSSFYHQRIRAGLIGRLSGATNKHVPLMRPVNLHVSSICDPRLLAFVYPQ